MFLKSLAGAWLVACAVTPVMADDCLPYEPATVTLMGKLSMARGYGPPGFGEDPKHGAKEAYGLLTLDKPVCVSGGSDPMDDNVKATRAFQLVPTGKIQLDRHLIGARVAVTGTLFHRVSGGHTDVMLMYDADVRKAP